MNDKGEYWPRKLTRRRALQGTALGSAGLAAVTMFGCGGNATQPSTSNDTPGARQPKRGGVLSHHNSQETRGEGFDPHTSTPLKGEGYRLFYQGLLDYHPVTFEVQPQLSPKWEQPSQTEYVFTLQPGVKWQNKPPVNGRELNVQDVVYSLERARSDDPKFTSRTLLNAIDKITVVDRSTLKITAKAPDTTLLSKFSSDQCLVLAPEAVEKANKFATAAEAVGTGAFIIKSAEDDVGAEFVRNPDYWKPGLPYLDGVRTNHFGHPASNERAWAAFLAGELDTMLVPGNRSKDYLAQQRQGYTPLWFSDTTVTMTTPNTAAPPFDDTRVTKALRLLTDHDEFRSAYSEPWYGRGAHGSVLPPSLERWDLTQDQYGRLSYWKQPKDEAVREGLSLLSAAGYTRNSPVKVEILSSNAPFAEAATILLQSQFRRLGQTVVDAQVKLVDQPAYQSLRASRSFTYGMFTNAAAFNEPDAWFDQVYSSKASRNYWGVSDSKLDDMFSRQRSIFDVQQRTAAVKEIVQYMADGWPGAIVSQQYYLNAVKPQLQNFLPEFWLHGAQYENVWLDT